MEYNMTISQLQTIRNGLIMKSLCFDEWIDNGVIFHHPNTPEIKITKIFTEMELYTIERTNGREFKL